MMSTFQHNPYRQFPPPQPSTDNTIHLSRQTRQRCPLRTAPDGSVLLRHSLRSAPAVAPAPQHAGSSLTVLSQNGSFVESRDGSATRHGKADVELVGTGVTATAATAGAVPPPVERCPYRPEHGQQRAPSRPPMPAMLPAMASGQPPHCADAAAGQLNTSSIGYHNNNSNSHSWQDRNGTASVSGSPHVVDPRAMADAAVPYAGVATPRSMPRSAASTSATAMSTMSVDMLATTLFIDGLPPTIENPFQLTPYVPPQGLVKVRVKRSRGRDVGFAVYESVDAASAALAWFHDIHMIKEVVQSSASSAVPSRGDIGAAHHPLLEALLYYRDLEGGVAPTYEHPLPIAYDDFVAASHNPGEYAKLLLGSISLRVEWAHTHEVYHLPQSMPKSYCPFLTGVITELPTSLQPWLSRNFRDTSTQEATIHEVGGHVRSISDVHFSASSREDSVVYSPPQFPPPPQQQQQQQYPHQHHHQPLQGSEACSSPPSQCPYGAVQRGGDISVNNNSSSNSGAVAPAAVQKMQQPLLSSSSAALPVPQVGIVPPSYDVIAARASGGAVPTINTATTAAAAAPLATGSHDDIQPPTAAELHSPALSERRSVDANYAAMPAYGSVPYPSFPSSPTLLSAAPSVDTSVVASAASGLQPGPHHHHHQRQSSTWSKGSDRRLPSRTLFVKLIHNFPVPPLNSVALQRVSAAAAGASADPFQRSGGCDGGAEATALSGNGTSAVEDGGVAAEAERSSNSNSSSTDAQAAAAMTEEDRAFFALAQRVCTPEFFSEQFAGFQRFRPFLHPPYYGGCFVLFERDTDMQRCLQWMRADARLMALFAVQPARSDTFER